MKTVAVVGGGAAGLVAAIAAAERAPGCDVVLLERTKDGGRKILISGGGRCNILPQRIEPDRFVTDSPVHIMRAMLRSWPLVKQREFFETEVGVPLTLERESGKWFPRSNRARDVRDRLIRLAGRRGVRFQFETVVGGLERNDRGWKLNTNRGPLAAAAVVMATGGLSVPSTGSDGSGIAAAKALGHTIRDTYPALTPLTADSVMQRSLAGLSLPVRLRAKWNGRTLESNGGFLFTHGGYSGPAILDISHVAVRSCSMPNRSDDVGRAEIRIAWTTRHADEWQRDLTASTRGLVVSALARHLPLRLAEHLMQEAGVPADRRRGELRRTERTNLVDVLTAFVLPWTGSEGYKKAEVTGGGVALDEVNPRTLESRRHPGLYLCGEMLDAFGPIGGHNFSWAWATGRAAGIGAAAAVSDGGRAPA